MSLLRPLLMYVVLPLWMLAGLADWACHRRTRIETTGGVRESVFHWVMFLQMAVVVLAVLFLEVNAAVLLLAGALFLAHEFTTWLELRYVVGRREVSPIEQMVHSFMELLPLAGLFLLAVLSVERYGGGALEPSAWTLRPKAEPLPAGYLAAALAGAALLNVLPLAEESWRCLRAGAASRGTSRAGAP
jgi:hypothetical protein